ncbi:hypothetical protein ACHAPT_013386 [Fusarium lateritium]
MDLLPQEMKDEILHLVHEHKLDPKLWRNAFTHEDTSRLPGHIPSWTELEEIREQAKECFNDSHEEVSWNMEVHHPLLKSVFRRSDPNQSLDFMSCATAWPHRNFLQWSVRQKLVDICLYSKTGLDTQALKDLGRRTVTDTVNHTDYQPLQQSF